MTYYKQLDGLRAIAIIAVMISHWLERSISIEVLKNLPYGSGVTLFFVLSGFLITKILLDFKEKNRIAGTGNLRSIKAFYIRRSLRIFPIYYLTIILLLIFGFGEIKTLFPWLATYTTNIYMTTNSTYLGPFTHFWSLAVEEQFYLFWVPIIIFIPKKYLKQTILYIIAASFLLFFYFKYMTPYWLADLLVICAMHILGLGALIAYYVKYKPDKVERLDMSKLKTLTLFLVVVFIIIFVFRPEQLFSTLRHFKYPVLSLIYALVVLIAVRNGFKGVMKYILENKVMIYIGRISYGLYIYHLFMSPLFLKVLKHDLGIKTTAFGYFLLFFIINIIIASASWFLLEKPINNIKKYFKY